MTLQEQTTDKEINNEFYKENVILDLLKTVFTKFNRNDNLCKRFIEKIIKQTYNNWF